MSHNLSRRDFLRGIVAGAAGIATGSILGACSSKTGVEETIEVETTLTNESVDTVHTTVGAEVGQGVVGPYLEYDVCGKLSMSEFVDAVAEAEPITTYDKEENYDVVVIGAGTAGVPCALAAYEAGAKVCLLQKTGAAVSQGSGFSFIDPEQTTGNGLVQLVHQMRENSNYRPDWNLNMTWAKNCAEACTWFMDKLKEAGMKEGADFTPKTLGHYEFSEGTAVTTMVDVKGGMVFPIRALCEYCESLFDVWYDTPAVQLVKEGGKVVGCYARNKDGEVVRFNAARGVVLATGDYQNNAAMVDKYCPDAAYFDKKQSGKTGDGHLMGMMAGAKMQPINHTKMIHAKNWGTNSTLMGSVPLFAVNMNGDRFCAEDVTFSLRCNIVKNQPEQAWINIMDSNYVVQLAEMGVSATSIEDFEASGEDNGNYKADTLEELAGKLGIPADHLIVSVDRYNELCELGYDADFGKEAKYLHTIKEAPFYAMHKEYAVSALTSGLIINSDAQVLDNDGNVIDGLYAVGNCSGSFYAAIDYPMAIAGLSLSRCITFGYLVGKKLG